MTKNSFSGFAISEACVQGVSLQPEEVRDEFFRLMGQIRLGLPDSAETVTDAPQEYFLLPLVKGYGAIVWKAEKDFYFFVFCDKKEEALRWASVHKCGINPDTNSYQVYEVPPVKRPDSGKEQKHQNKVVASLFEDYTPGAAAPENTSEKTLFAALSSEDLVSIGVPAEWTAAVKDAASREELDALAGRLPADATEALISLADGASLEDIQNAMKSAETEDAEQNPEKDALHTPGSRRNFLVVESDEAMRRIMNASLEQWRIFLHPAQKRLATRKVLTPTLVRGAAGTGKTVVAMHRAVYLVGREDWNPEKKLLFTTFSKNLATDISYQLDRLAKPEERKRIEVTNIDVWVAGFLRRNHVNKRIVYPGGKEYEAAWRAAMTVASSDAGLSESFYREEWQRIILPQEITEEKEYLRAPRKGRGTPITRKQRQLAWPVFDEMRSQLSAGAYLTIEDACFMAEHLLETQGALNPYQAVVVDEAQDLGNEALRLLAQLARPNGDKNEEPRIFLAGDGQQRIYDRQGSLASCGINVRGRRSERLKVTYRTTEEIRRVANAVLTGAAFDDMDEGVESRKGDLSNRHGSVPEVFVADSLEKETVWVKEKIENVRQSLNIDCSDICLVARTKQELGLYEERLAGLKIPTVRLSRKSSDDRGLKGVRLATMHRVKGLEYRVVFIVGASAGAVPLGRDTQDAEEVKKGELTERSLFYVAASRAKDALFVSCVGEPGEFIKLIQESQTIAQKA